MIGALVAFAIGVWITMTNGVPWNRAVLFGLGCAVVVWLVQRWTGKERQ